MGSKVAKLCMTWIRRFIVTITCAFFYFSIFRDKNILVKITQVNRDKLAPQLENYICGPEMSPYSLNLGSVIVLIVRPVVHSKFA